MNQNRPFSGISGSTLKLIAVITMLIDHTGATVLRAVCRLPSVLADPQRQLFWNSVYAHSRSIGRIAFPIFCFLLVEGFLHTRNVRRYAGRMLLFALISEIPFDLALKGNWYFPDKQNVYFTLLIGLLVLIGFRLIEQHVLSDSRSVSSELVRWILCAAVLAAGMYLSYLIDTDYNYKGVFLIGILYLTRSSRLLQCFAGAVSIAWEMPAPIAFLPVWLYNGKRGLRMKYFFYWFYPVHLLLLHAIVVFLIQAR